MILWLLILLEKVIFQVDSHIHAVQIVELLLLFQMEGIILVCILLKILSMVNNLPLIIAQQHNLHMNILIQFAYVV